MPDALEFPGMRRAIVRQMRARAPVAHEFVADWPPGFPAVIGSLDQLAKPSAVLRGIEPFRVSGRSLHMGYLPAGKMGASDLPPLAQRIGSQDECTLAGPHQYSYAAHWLTALSVASPLSELCVGSVNWKTAPR